MGIRVAHEAVGMPLIAAYATGVGKAQERRRKEATGILMEQDRLNRAQQERAEDRGFRADENALNRAHDFEMFDVRNQEMDRRRDKDFDREKELLGVRNDMYRDKDELGVLHDEIAMREKFMLNTPLNEQGVKNQQEAARSLEWIRRQRDSVRPDAYRQYLSQWVSEFDNRNPSSWEKTPPKPEEAIRADGVLISPDGRHISYDDWMSGKERMGGMISPDSKGASKLSKYGGEAGFPATSQEYFSVPKNFNDARKEAIAALTDPVKGPPKDMAAVKAKMQELYEMQRDMATPVQQAGQAPGTPAPAGPANKPAASQAPLNAGDPATQAMQQKFSQRADPQYNQRLSHARDIVSEYQYLYANIQSLDDIKNPDDRRELEEALKVLEGDI